MRRVSIFLIVACISFATGVMVAWCRQILPASSPGDSAVHEVRPPAGENNDRRYMRGPAGLAIRGSFITLNSSDGMWFTKWSVHCRSSEEAANMLRDAIQNAAKIVSREITYGEYNQTLGEKVIALFDDKKAPASLLWTENNEFFQVEGASLHDILEYRKDFRR